MKKIIIITVSTLLFISQFSFGQKPVPWVADAYKVANPNELAYLLYYEIECGGDKAEVAEMVEGVFIRSRISPVEYIIFAENVLFLHIRVTCQPLNSDTLAFNFEIEFGRYDPSPAVFYAKNYGNNNIGIGDEDFLFAEIKKGVEDAITDYILVNFEL